MTTLKTAAGINLFAIDNKNINKYIHLYKAIKSKRGVFSIQK